MTAHHAATLNFQELISPEPRYGYRDPNELIGRFVCCKCRREVVTYAFIAKDGSQIETHHCREHGDVPPMRSHIVNGEKIR